MFFVCMYVCMHACMYVCIYECMYVCMHACMYVCMKYVCVYIYIHTCGSHQSHQLCERWLTKAPVTVVIGTINQFVKLELYTNLAIVNGGPIVYIII